MNIKFYFHNLILKKRIVLEKREILEKKVKIFMHLSFDIHSK